MIMTDQPESPNRNKATKIVIQMVVGAVVGFASVMALDRFVGLENVEHLLNGSEFAALLMAIIFALIGLTLLLTSASRKLFAMNPAYADTSEIEFRDMRPLLFWSAICLIVYAAALAVLALASANAAGQQLPSFWAVVGAMVAQFAITWHLWRRYDELYREITKDSCAVAFTVTEIMLFIWAAAEICGLGIVFDPLAVIVAMTAVYWVAAIWLTVRRGIA